MQARSPRESDSSLPEECRSRVRHPSHQKPDAAIKKFTAKEQEDQVDQQSEEDEKIELRVAYTSRQIDILFLIPAEI